MARGKYKRPTAAVVTTTAAPVPVPGGTGRRPASADAPLLGAAVMSPWGWRVMAVFAMVGIGVCLTLYLDGKVVYGALWTVVAGAWSAFAAFLWRRHLAWDRHYANN